MIPRSNSALVFLSLLFIFMVNSSWAVDPCSFISQEEAAVILGEPVKAARTAKTTGFAVGSSCKYYTAVPLADSGGAGLVSLVMYDTQTMKQGDSIFVSPKKYYRRLLEASRHNPRNKIQGLDNLAEQAYWQGGEDRLHLLEKDLYFILTINDLEKISSKKGRADLAAKLSRHRLDKCLEAAQNFLLPKVQEYGKR